MTYMIKRTIYLQQNFESKQKEVSYIKRRFFLCDINDFVHFIYHYITLQFELIYNTTRIIVLMPQ